MVGIAYRTYPCVIGGVGCQTGKGDGGVVCCHCNGTVGRVSGSQISYSPRGGGACFNPGEVDAVVCGVGGHKVLHGRTVGYLIKENVVDIDVVITCSRLRNFEGNTTV